MDGRVFLDAARHLLAATSEVNRRTAAGPIYLAVVNEARAALERWGFSRPAPEDVKEFVLACFDNAVNLDALRGADAVRRTEQRRTLASHDLAAPGLFADDGEVTRLLYLAVGGIDLLDQLEADTVRRAAVITAIQAARP
jgi:hypothetical protein